VGEVRAPALQLPRACDAPASAGDVLELACGTGLWTQRLAPHAASLTAIDGSPEMLERCRARVNDPGVRYVTADLSWRAHVQTTPEFFIYGHAALDI
jgi:trans-aconitate methyltransferase